MPQDENPSRRTEFRGLPINIEIEAGATKSGVDDLGEKWSHKYEIPYGEIPNTVGADSEPVDVYLGPDEQAPDVFVVHQSRRDGNFDEDKVFCGVASAEEAERLYRAHGPDFGFTPGCMEAMTWDEFETDYLADNSALGRGTVDL